MKPGCFILLFLFFALITNSSFVCITPRQLVTIDSIKYFKPDQIILTAESFKDTVIQLNLNNKHYSFSKDSSTNFRAFKATRDDRNIYILTNIVATYINDTTVLTTIKYQAFDKIKLTNSSKIFELKNVPFSLKSLDNFLVRKKDYDLLVSDKSK
ncbi:hypothetical protein DC498_10505 [Terrimonas sp.]|uniref:hypothetical protein n=1 Tax=Terrimonas sp. TaxID=1914338 RepID=UPI000D51E364|nr:hypothetical protein [Terrimonas sp.]PVD52153.1 hypothetical protein DC498_10505 [Terrimonas sp.]